MSKEATVEYVERIRFRYGKMRTKRAKGRLLDDFCATTDLSRKHAIKVLNSSPDGLRSRGRRPRYGPDVAEAVKAIWLAADQPCAKLLHPVMGCYVASYERRHGAFEEPVRSALLQVSASTIDRLLAPVRVLEPRRHRRPQGIAAVKQQVDIRAGEWAVDEPGWMEVDTVAHCGGSMQGNFLWSLTMTDVHTQWTEVRMMWNRGATGTLGRVQEVIQALPFQVLGLDCDNGGEFLNWHLHDYCRTADPAIEFTRSRPYMKNDQAHVEQKNGTHVRRLLGHDRIGDVKCVPEINEVGILWSLWKNLFCPVQKLVSKSRIGHRYQKKYDTPRTPAQRLLESDHVAEKTKKHIRSLLKEFDCLDLKTEVDKKLKRVFERMDKRAKGQRCPAFPGLGPSALRAAPSGTVPNPGKAA